MKLGEIIKEYRTNHSLSMGDFAKLSGISKAYVSILEKNKDPRNGKPIIPSLTTIDKVAKGMGISFDELFYQLGDNEIVSLTSTLTLITETSSKLDEVRQEEVLEFAEEKLEEQEKQADNNVDEIHETLYPYTVTEKIAAASGLPHGYSYDQDQNETFTLYSDKFITKAYDIASQVTGNSMEPNYHDGDVVLIKKGYDNINGSIYVVDYDGKTYLKKLYLEENHFRLVSINDTYDDIIIDLPVDENLYFNIVGKVVDSFTPVEV